QRFRLSGCFKRVSFGERVFRTTQGGDRGSAGALPMTTGAMPQPPAARELAEQNPEANLAPVIEELDAIATADDEALERAKLPSLIVPEVRATLEALRGAQAGTAP